MANKSIKKNYIYNLTFQILTLIIPLITTPYLSRVLGAEGIGIYSYVESISAYFVLFATLGLTIFGQREVSYVQDDIKKRTIVFWETFIIQLVSSLICIVAYVFFSFLQNDPLLYLVLVINLFTVIANVSWLFQGMEEFGRIVLRNIIFKLLGLAYVFIFVTERDDVIVYLFGVAFFAFLNNLSYWTMLPKFVNRPSLKDLHPTRHLKTVFSLFLPTIAISIYTVLDKTMIGVITDDPCENGYYEQAIKMSKVVLTIVTSLGAVMVPRIGHYFSKGDMASVKSSMYNSYRFVWLVSIPLALGLISVSSNFVPWFYGKGFDEVVPLLGILGLLIIAIGISNVTGIQYLIPTGRQNFLSISVITGAVVNFALNLFFIRYYASIGAAVASVIAEFVISILQLYLVRKELSAFEIIKSGIHYYIAGAVMLAVLFFIRDLFTPSMINTLYLVVIGAATYFLSLIILRDDFLLSNVNIIVKKVLKRA